MIPINNSDTAWLIVSDFNQDNQLGYPDCLREDILNPNINDWHWEFTFVNVGGGDSTVGTIGHGFVGVVGRVGAVGKVGEDTLSLGGLYDPYK